MQKKMTAAQVGVLVTETKGRHRKRVMRFRDGGAALRWCEKQGAVLVYFPAGAENRN
jgi:hypothetical protein